MDKKGFQRDGTIVSEMFFNIEKKTMRSSMLGLQNILKLLTNRIRISWIQEYKKSYKRSKNNQHRVPTWIAIRNNPKRDTNFMSFYDEYLGFIIWKYKNLYLIFVSCQNLNKYWQIIELSLIDWVYNSKINLTINTVYKQFIA